MRGSILAVCLLTAVYGQAQEAIGDVHHLDDVKVLAEKREDTLQNVPESVTVLTGDALDSEVVQDIRDASWYVPNLFVSGFAARHTAFPFFRGLGGSGQGDPPVTVYVDGVPRLTFNTVDLEFLDVERIEFIRGPQGTLYGRNTLGGAIQIVTRRPSLTDLTLSAGATYGTHDLQRYRATVSVPVVPEQAALSLSGSWFTREGYTENLETGNDLDDRRSLAGRAQLLLAPGDNVEVMLSLQAERDRDGGFVLYDLWQLRNHPHKVRYDFEGTTKRDVLSPSMTINVYGDRVDFVSISSWEHWETQATTDTDFSRFDRYRRTVNEHQDAVFQEFRLQSPEDDAVALGDGLDLTWLVGIAWFHSEFSHDEANEARPGVMGPTSAFQHGNYDLEDWGLGTFGQVTLTMAEQVDLTLGLRHQCERKRWDLDLFVPFLGGQREALSEDYEQWLPKIELAWRPTGNLLGYVSAAKGYRSGGFNRNLLTGGPYTYDEETSWTYEAGIKSTWFDRRLAVNAAVFHTEWRDMQVNRLNTNTPFPNQFYLDNVGKARSRGVELESTARLTDTWSLFAGFGLADTEYLDYTDPATGVDYSGNDIPNVPEYTWHSGIEYRQEINDDWEVFTRADLVGLGDIQYDSGNAEHQGPIELVNWRAGVTLKAVTLELWVANLLDREYVPLAFESGTPSGYVARNGEPRTFGVTLSASF